MSRASILAIDDTPTNLLILRGALAAEFDLRIATSGAEGLALAAAAPPDLVLLDVMMPEMDGYEVCRRLKADQRLGTVPVIFVTALSQDEDQAAGLALGAADYITKPINVGIARQRIRNLLEREGLRKEVEFQRDVLEQRVAERTQALSRAKEAAETANVAKSAFLANMSHEIRTPLNAITGMAMLIRRSGVSPEQAERLNKIEAAGQHLAQIINAILDLSNIEAGKFTLEDSALDVGAILADVAAQLDALAQAKGLALGIEAEAAPADLRGDAARIRQALLNYVGNAIKFTEAGRVTLRLRVETDSGDSALLRFEVEDTGIGIAPEALARLFSAFEQADNSITRPYGGTGLGLAITRRLAELMGGAAGVSSRPGQGSVFWFTVRLQRAATTPN